MNNFVGQKLKALRISQFLTQESLADKLHISQSTYARMENGKSNSWVNHIEGFCKLYQIQPEELLRFSDELPSYNTDEKAIDKVLHTLIQNLENQIKEKDELISYLKEQLRKALAQAQ
ncbi:helix-turn-helix domain-containing protein [Flavobacterium sp. NKUCC04_CG]|uniref:helix-turn-helix domain-containing protein n=1 Tax=Flavobacterium sp. NKUCC04_CG TaxID=2842121 RepID=UPI001C5B275E|nr:helix-turn-helix transcriptional regulator [Flavobacterium sp. NKUCC04_CG]MBW3520299.1 helix-turn-helix domain-containing protein [Flavobacterium sp. NKUCC04_CG]